MTDVVENPSSSAGCSCYFEAQHQQHAHPAMRALEQSVLGCNYGGTSWTTREQADQICSLLELTHDTHLLEIGAGSGWPGLHLSESSGCQISLVDLPVSALQIALERAKDENIGHRCQAIAANGIALPFQSAIFKAIEHSDVLCCLPEKLEFLMECHRVSSSDAKMLFYVIAPAENLDEQQLKTALEVGPPFVGVPDDYPSLLSQSGWQIDKRVDVTADYLSAINRFVDGLRSDQLNLETLMGKQEYKDQLKQRLHQIEALQQGMLVREMFLVSPAI